MHKKIVSFLLILLLVAGNIGFSSSTFAVEAEPEYLTLRDIDKWTFNEYRYKIAEKFFKLREFYKIEWSIDVNTAQSILNLADSAYKYLPDNLVNKNHYNTLVTDLKRAIKYPDSSSSYNSVLGSIDSFLEKTDIKSIQGTIEVSPKEGNAPMTVSFRGRVTDPSGTQIPNYNYIWWVDNGGKKQILGRSISISHVFKEEGKYTVFLDVISNHKNENGLTDVLPFRTRTEIIIKEKIASLILKVNGETLWNQDTLKFSPEEGNFWIVFDATSSTPTSWAKFISTKWDFGNGVKREYNTAPKIERVRYANEGDYTVTLTMKTNELKQVERKFVVSVHSPIASISTNKEEGYIGDQFTFKAKTTGNQKNLSYDWEIIDIDNDKVILNKTGSNFNYTFLAKGKYNIKMKVTESSWDVDIDTRILYINSRAPVADFTFKIPKLNNPNTILLDGSKTHDPDYSDEWKLSYAWIIDGNKVTLENSSGNGAIGYYTFDSIGEPSITLEVTDPDNITAVKTQKAKITSVLSVDVTAIPKVIQREQFVKFIADSQKASFYEWDFGDGEKDSWKNATINHIFKKSGIFDVQLIVRDNEWNANKTITKVYVSDSNSPYAMIKVSKGQNEIPVFNEEACGWVGAYEVDRVLPVTLSWNESINVDGQNTWLTYSWKIGNDKYVTSPTVTQKFDELGCFPIKLTVTSNKTGLSHSVETNVEVKNLAPELSSLQVDVVDLNTDPVIVNVSALWAKDRDGVVQTYLWYYYTDIDNEPQDFRSTTRSSTTFVLPKITGNYYFVLVMKDNNEARANSDDITGSKFYMTLAGDNLNTPIVDFGVNDSSVNIGQEIVFTANTKNILWQDISKEVEYSWDFDGDGFYDKVTKEKSVNHTYETSWDFLAKVKVKFKGFSNTRNLNISVTNPLTADFWYISIGSKIIFLNKSSGKIDSVMWDLWDGNKKKDENTFSHIYEDGKSSHDVVLTVTEGTKVKTMTQKVYSNIKNILVARKKWINIFSFPWYDENLNITLSWSQDKVYIYLSESIADDIGSYGVDYDVAVDSDLNGGADDDEDNKWLPSYKSWEALEIPLTKEKIQKIRVMIKNGSWVLLDSKDLTITKEYIKQREINLDEVIFDGVTEEEKQKIDELKSMVKSLTESDRMQGMMYVQRLQEEWFDATEKTKIIIEFEWFLDKPTIINSAEIIDLLESLLVLGQDDKSEKNIAYNALKALIPDGIECPTLAEWICKDILLEKLEAINISSDVEENKKIGSEMLLLIKDATVMTSKEKLDFKAVLKIFVYGGLSEVPVEEQEETVEEESKGDSNIIVTIFKVIWYGLLIILGLLLGVILIFFIYYKTKNNDENVSFTDFIISKTGNRKQEDVLGGDVKPVIKKEEDRAVETPVENKKEEEILETNTSDTTVPTWLKWVEWSTEAVRPEEEEVIIPEEPAPTEPQSETSKEELLIPEESTVKEEKIPDWLKGSFDTPAEVENNETPKESEEADVLGAEITQNKEAEDITQINELKVPDWLKGSFDTPAIEETKQEEPIISEEVITPQENKEEEIHFIDEEIVTPEELVPTEPQSETSKEELLIPDWLKGSFDTKAETITTEPEEVDEEDFTQVVDEEEKKAKKRRNKKVETTDEKGAKTAWVNGDELWSDGMGIPDWLQDKKSSWDDSKNK